MAYVILKALNEWATSEAQNMQRNQAYRQALSNLAVALREVMTFQ